VLALGACGSAPAPAPVTTTAPGAASAAATSPASPRGVWTTVATLSGKGGNAQDTAPFSLHGGQVKFIYSVEPNDSGPVPFLWKLYRKGDAVNPTNTRASNSCASCDGKQTNDLDQVPAGDYFLHVTTSRSWTLVVQEHG
jgi:hypothetical protein